MLSQDLYEAIEVDSWSQLVLAYENLPKVEDGAEKKWLYRGQKRTLGDKFVFVTSLERAADSFNHASTYSRRDLERKLQREFRRRLHHYTMYVPDEADTLELWALMQHHGAPTRLLDWTYSFFVAAFFAVEIPSDWYEVWAINAEWFCAETIISDKADELRGRAQERAISAHRDVPIAEQQAIIDHLINEHVAAVHNVNPLRLNERLTIQQGVFLFPGDIDSSFEQNLSAAGYSVNSRKNLVRLRIDNQARKEILQALHRMNINRATLFPGLDGFATSLWTRLASPEILG